MQTLLLLTFANGVPMDNGTVAEKAFALAIAGSGLVAFALTVALIQQVQCSAPIELETLLGLLMALAC